MNTMQLGDYRGGRDTITNLMGAQIPQLQNVTDAAKTFASIGLQGMAQRHALESKADLDLRNAMALRNNELGVQMGLNNMKMGMAEEAAQRQATAEADLMAGGESAMLDWANNVMGLYEPDSPEFKQAKKALDMIAGRKKGTNAFNKGYLSFINERNIGDAMSQGTAGAAGWQPAKKPTPAANKKPLPKPSPQGYGDDDLNS